MNGIVSASLGVRLPSASTVEPTWPNPRHKRTLLRRSRGIGRSAWAAPPIGSSALPRPHAAEDGQFQPLEVAVGVLVPDLPEPAHLGLNGIEEIVGLVGAG